MERNYLLSPARQLTEDEQSLVWQKPTSHVESEAERRICEAVKHNWNRGEMKISTILLEGDAGSGKTQLAKALSADFGLPYTKVTCFADMDKSDVLGAILPVFHASAQYNAVRALSFFVGPALRHFVPRQAPAAGARLSSALIRPTPKNQNGGFTYDNHQLERVFLLV